MINIPYEKLVEKIMSLSKLSEKEIDEKVKNKLNQLAGLISKEGAAHIIANELGINLLQTQGVLKIKDILAGMRQIELLGKVIRKYEVREFSNEKRSGKVAKFLIGDETGSTMIVLWNDQADLLEKVNAEDIVKILNANVRENNGYMEVHLGEGSALEVNPEGVEIKTKVNSSNNYAQATRKKISELQENDTNIEIFATIVQIFDPKFFEIDSVSGKRIKREEGTNPPENATYGAVLNVFADDGSDNIRVVLWKNQLLNLTGKSWEQLLECRKNIASFEEVKTDLLGQMVKFIGKVNKNQMFGRLEFVAQRVIKEVDPEEEIKRLQKTANESKSANEDKSVNESKSTNETNSNNATSENSKVQTSTKPDVENVSDKEVLEENKSVEKTKQEADNSVNKENESSKPTEDDLVEEELLSLEDLEDID